jgi:hypothetical protein
MICGSLEDNSGEILRSLLTPCSPPTRVSDDIGDTDDVEAETILSVRDSRLISVIGGHSSFRRFGGGIDGVDTECPGLHVRLFGGWMVFDGGGTPLFAGGTWYVDGGTRRMDPDGSQGTNCVFRRGPCPTLQYGCWVAALLTAGGHRWRLSTDSFGCASSGCESGRDSVVRCEPRCLEGYHGRNMQYMNDASSLGSLGRESRGSRYPH